MRRTLIRPVRKKPRPRSEGSSRGRPPVHSKEKLYFACLWVMADNQTYRKTESDLGGMRTPRDGEPAPDHTTPVRHMQTIPSEWTGVILAPDRPPLPGRPSQHRGQPAVRNGLQVPGYGGVIRDWFAGPPWHLYHRQAAPHVAGGLVSGDHQYADGVQFVPGVSVLVCPGCSSLGAGTGAPAPNLIRHQS